MLSLDQVADLERYISYDEIKSAVWDCGTDKSPGPDGFTFEFFRRYWNIIDHDVVSVVSTFFSTATFPRGCNASFIALIPKTCEAKLVKDFHPISLIGSIYKIIAKILANRLSYVIPDLISEVQSAFVANRQILDGHFILNELLSWCKSKKFKAMIFKVDFEKAFDSVRWDFFDDVLKSFGFGNKWRGWINGCLNFAMGLILVNGCPTFEFQFYKGLKQGHKINIHKSKLMGVGFAFDEVESVARIVGCSIFSSLFTYLGVKVGGVMSRIKSWDEVKCNLTSRLSKWTIKTLSIGGRLTLLKSVLSSMPLYHMSIFKVPMGVLKNMEIRFAKFSLTGSKARMVNGVDIVGKFFGLKKMDIHGVQVLSIVPDVASDLHLCSMPLYHMFIFKVPMGVLKNMESMRRNFFNGVEGSNGKMALICWEKVLASKKKGGLGVSSFFALNRALIFKWVWRFISQGSSLWYRFIKAIHGVQGALDCSSVASRSSPWLDIIREINSLINKGVDLMAFARKRWVTGKILVFWDEIWLGDTSLKDKFLRLFALETYKHISVAAKMLHASPVFSFRHPPRGGVEEEQINRLLSSLINLSFPQMLDRWVWYLESTGEFSVKSVRNLLDDVLLNVDDVPTRWVRVIPIKVNVFAWRVRLDSLPTRLNLSLRGLEIPSIVCPLCNVAVESTSHLLFSCSLSRQVRSKVMRWWELADLEIRSYDEWLNWLNNVRLPKNLKDVLEGVCYVNWWLVWRFRNQMLFGKTHPRRDLNRYLKQLRSSAPELLRVKAMHDHPIIKYGFSTLERASFADMTNSNNLVAVRTASL
ncbi:RNA-directed DNA polymerase, eukaryota [Tanacetum coccineum]